MKPSRFRVSPVMTTSHSQLEGRGACSPDAELANPRRRRDNSPRCLLYIFHSCALSSHRGEGYATGTALSKHAGLTRGVYGIPHSQRSNARLSIEFDKLIWIEDVLEMCNKALTTETLVFCKRQDEQAFAEKNGAQPKFVEDAIRYLANELNENTDVKDYKVICSHQESLHSHDAVAVITKGVPGSIFNHHVTLGEWQSMSV